MTSAIDTTDWTRLNHAFGTCDHFPVALRGLASDVEELRHAAYWQLDNHVVVQGDLYEPAPYVVRALNELLETKLPSKKQVYDLLIELANGYAPPSSIVTIDGQQVPLKQATVESLITGIDAYWRDLGDPDHRVRELAINLLLALAECATLDCDELYALWNGETNDETKGLLQELIDECLRVSQSKTESA